MNIKCNYYYLIFCNFRRKKNGKMSIVFQVIMENIYCVVNVQNIKGVIVYLVVYISFMFYIVKFVLYFEMILFIFFFKMYY